MSHSLPPACGLTPPNAPPGGTALTKSDEKKGTVSKPDWSKALVQGAKISVWNETTSDYEICTFTLVGDSTTAAGFRCVYANAALYHDPTHWAFNPPGLNSDDCVGEMNIRTASAIVTVTIQTNPTSQWRFFFKIKQTPKGSPIASADESMAVGMVAMLVAQAVSKVHHLDMQIFFAGNMANLMARDKATNELVCIRGLTEPVMKAHGHGVLRLPQGFALTIGGEKYTYNLNQIGQEVSLMTSKSPHQGNSVDAFSQWLCDTIQAAGVPFVPRKQN